LLKGDKKASGGFCKIAIITKSNAALSRRGT
jgi:hypothetical protein